MLVNILAAKAAEAAENFKGMSNEFWGIFTFILGMLVVFAGMIVLVICVSLVAKALERGSKKAEEKEDAQAEQKELEVVQTQMQDDVDEKTRVAVIAAVLAYLTANGGAKNEFIVRKIKKLKN